MFVNHLYDLPERLRSVAYRSRRFLSGEDFVWLYSMVGIADTISRGEAEVFAPWAGELARRGVEQIQSELEEFDKKGRRNTLGEFIPWSRSESVGAATLTQAADVLAAGFEANKCVLRLEYDYRDHSYWIAYEHELGLMVERVEPHKNETMATCVRRLSPGLHDRIREANGVLHKRVMEGHPIFERQEPQE